MALRKTSQTLAIDAEAREHAGRIIARWREQGFNTLLCYRSGYCTPVNSTVSHGALPVGYRYHALDSQDAVEALAHSIASGDTHRV